MPSHTQHKLPCRKNCSSCTLEVVHALWFTWHDAFTWLQLTRECLHSIAGRGSGPKILPKCSLVSYPAWPRYAKVSLVSFERFLGCAESARFTCFSSRSQTNRGRKNESIMWQFVFFGEFVQAFTKHINNYNKTNKYRFTEIKWVKQEKIKLRQNKKYELQKVMKQSYFNS